MQIVSLLVGLSLAVLAHLAGARAFPEFPLYVDLFVIVAAVRALEGRSLPGMLGGLAVGLTHDVLSGGPYGFYGFADTLIGYAVARAAQRVIGERLAVRTLVVMLAVLCQEAVLLALEAALLGGPRLPDPLALTAKAAIAGAVAFALTVGLRAWRRRRDRRRQDRVHRLRMSP